MEQPARMYHPSDQEMPCPDEDEPYANANKHDKMMKALAKWFGVTGDTEESLRAHIRKRVYKDTICGASISFEDEAISVAGYCEGSDADLPLHRLEWPFTKKVFCTTLDECDLEADTEWHRTHGCDTCAKHWQEQGVTDEDEQRNIWTECPDCKGEGIII